MQRPLHQIRAVWLEHGGAFAILRIPQFEEDMLRLQADGIGQEQALLRIDPGEAIKIRVVKDSTRAQFADLPQGDKQRFIRLGLRPGDSDQG